MEENNNININNNINLISDEKTLKENKDYFKASYLNFQSYANNAELSIQNEIKNIKKNKKLSINRDLFWKILLGILPYNKSKEWKEIISEERTKYHEAKKQFITNDIAEFIITKKIKDKYSSYFKFKDILSEEDYKYLDIIKIDVTRTFQKIELFKEEKIQEILINVLFIYAKKNKEIGYRQGMSDLCAIFLYVLYKDKFLDATFINDNSTFDFFLLNSNNEFLENDTFSLFSKFMEKGYSQFFLYSDEKYKDGELSQIDKEKKKMLNKDEIINSNDSDLKKRIFLVYYQEFPLVDKQLYQYMEDKIEPELFIIKWYLCIFSREIELPQLVELWDLILYVQYLDDKNKKNQVEKIYAFKFIDYIALSLLINVKNLIMTKKAGQLMSFLMKYPKDTDFKNIFTKAIELYNKVKGNIKI